MIYAPNAVEHILTGKAIARAVRAHLLVDAALNTLMLSKALTVPISGMQDTPNESEEMKMKMLHQIRHLLQIPDRILTFRKLVPCMIS